MCDHTRTFCTLEAWRLTKTCSSGPSPFLSSSHFLSLFTVWYLPLPFAQHFQSVTFCITACFHNLNHESHNLTPYTLCSIVEVYQSMQQLVQSDSTERWANMGKLAGQHRHRLTHCTAENTSPVSLSQCKCLHITISNPTDHQMPALTSVTFNWCCARQETQIVLKI